MKTFFLLLWLTHPLLIGAQEENSFAWRPALLYGKTDTLRAKLLFLGDRPHVWDRLTLLQGTDTSYLKAEDVKEGVTVITDDSSWYFAVIQKQVHPKALLSLFVQRIYTGRIELYKHVYVSWNTKRRTATNTYYQYTDYYLSKPGPEHGNTLVQLEKMNRKAMAPWLADAPGLLNQVPARFGVQELLNLLKQYDTFFIKKSDAD